MNSFIEPVGTRPRGVYWRRRAITAAGLVVAVLMLGKACGSGAPELGTRAAGEGPVPLVSTFTPTPRPTDVVLDGGDDALPGVHGGGSGIGSGLNSAGPGIGSGITGSSMGAAAGPVKPLAGAGPTKSPTATPKAAGASKAGATAKPTPTPTPTPVVVTTCKKSALAVTLRSDARTYTGAKTPKLFIAVRNVGEVACLADLGSDSLTLTVKSGKDRIWSSDDCQGKGTSDVRLLKPGQALEARSVWSKVRSAPGCPKGMPQAKPGTYILEGSADGVKAKKRAVFQLT